MSDQPDNVIPLHGATSFQWSIKLCLHPPQRPGGDWYAHLVRYDDEGEQLEVPDSGVTAEAPMGAIIGAVTSRVCTWLAAVDEDHGILSLLDDPGPDQSS